MNCPKCGSASMRPWPWQDGGYKGVACDSCGVKWWSDRFASEAYDAEVAATERLVENSRFPTDAEDDESRQATWASRR